jgi:hypothetical protein
MVKKKSNNNPIMYLAGFLIIFGFSGLIYGLLPYPYPLGSISIIIGLILVSINVISEKTRRK